MKSLTDMAGDLEIPTAQILTALRIVATRAQVPELARWAAKEMEGYNEDDELPGHRVWKLTIVGSLHNPMQAFFQDVLLGDFAIAEEYRERVTTYRCRNSVGDIEGMLENKQDGNFGVEHPNLAALINTGPMKSEAWTCTHASAKFSKMHLRGVVTKARQTALGLCLQCEENGVELQWGNAEDTSHEERAQWVRTLRDDGTRAIIRAACDSLRAMIAGG